MMPVGKTYSRQQPGPACEDCRQRKLRCDREKPQCGNCMELGMQCQIRSCLPPRGPKKGYVQELRGKITELETRLSEYQNGAQSPASNNGVMEIGVPSDNMIGLFNLGDIQFGDQTTPPSSDIDGDAPILFDSSTTKMFWQPSTSLSEEARADLDQLYFDRLHAFCPMLHRRRYLSWANDSTIVQARVCLQHAMWTIAAALSSQFQNIRDSLYRDTRQMIDAQESGEKIMETLRLEHIQANILLSSYEFMLDLPQRALIRMGRVFRMVQLMRLYAVDSQGAAAEDVIEMEERRRTFWVAYSLDGFLSLNNRLPLTLNEQEIYTRLPIPEDSFQSGRLVVMGFLSEVMAGMERTAVCPFTECIVMATICGRSLRQKQRSTMERVYGELSESFWEQHRWLNSLLMTQIQVLSRTSGCFDPMMIFVNHIAQAVVFVLQEILESLPTDVDEYLVIKTESEQLSIAAANDTCHLTKELFQLNRFQIHPLMQIPLSLSARFFRTHGQRYSLQLEEISKALNKLTNANLTQLNIS